jgi:hypothetical protein
MWKEEVVACFGVQSIHLYGVTEQNYVSHCQDCWCSEFLLIAQARGADIGLRKDRQHSSVRQVSFL